MSNRKTFRYIITMIAVFLLAISVLTGCENKLTSRRVVFTTGFGKNEVFRIETISCTAPEFMVYLTDFQKTYESAFGPEIWTVEQDGVSLEDNVKDTVLARIAQVKSICLLAESKGIELTEEEQNLVKQAASEFMEALTEEERAALGVTSNDVITLYQEYLLADKTYQTIVSSVNPEISDDEARTITVQKIQLKTTTTNGRGELIEYTEDMKEKVYNNMAEIWTLATEGGEGFLDLAYKYNEEGDVVMSFHKGEQDPMIEAVAFDMETGEISEIIALEDGYAILKCISTFDRAQTDENKIKIVEERRKVAFGEEYEAFVETLARKLNKEVWDQISLRSETTGMKADFFGIYEKYFAQK